MQKYRHSFSMMGLFSGSSEGLTATWALVNIFPSLSGGHIRAAISPKHLIASIRDEFGTTKLLRISGISWVSNM